MRKKRTDATTLSHKVFGEGAILHKRTLDAGSALVVRFGATDRVILVNADCWLSSPEEVRGAFTVAKPEPQETPKARMIRTTRSRNPTRDDELAEVLESSD